MYAVITDINSYKLSINNKELLSLILLFHELFTTIKKQ